MAKPHPAYKGGPEHLVDVLYARLRREGVAVYLCEDCGIVYTKGAGEICRCTECYSKNRLYLFEETNGEETTNES